MKSRYSGNCFLCHKFVPAGKGDIQSIGSLPKHIKIKHTGPNYRGNWLIRCFDCKGKGNI